jgi:hypothetical protein
MPLGESGPVDSEVIMAKRLPYSFSARTRHYLTAAGWTPDRAVPVSTYVEAYGREGLVLSSAAKMFLRNFGGLLIRYEAASGQDDVLGFTADEAVRNMGGGILAQTEQQFAVGRLCPLGHYLWGMCLVLQADDGAVYGLVDDRRVLLGKSGEESVDNVLSLEEPQVLESEYLSDLRNVAVELRKKKKA